MIIFPSHVFKLNYICRVLLCKVTCSKVPGVRVWTSWVEKSIFLLPTVSTINIPRRYVWVAACNRPFPFLENYPSIHSELLLYLSYLHVLPYISQIHIFLKNLLHTHTHTRTHTQNSNHRHHCHHREMVITFKQQNCPSRKLVYSRIRMLISIF